MEADVKEISINGIAYVKKEDVGQKAESLDGMPYQIVRTYSAGVFAGYVASRNGQEVVVKKARRLWYWEGAASLSQLAQEGTSKPSGCKFPCEVDTILLTQAVELLDVTEKAKKSIASVKVWQS
ncbi:conserved hypothetical protein [Gammaproteobacteria bacterium]